MDRAWRPQAQAAQLMRLRSRNRQVVGRREDLVGVDPILERARPAAALDHATAELDAIKQIAARDFPGIALIEPQIGALDLPAVLDLLREQAATVAEPVATGRQIQIGHAVEKTRRQPAETAIAEGGLGLDLGDLVEIEPVLGKGSPAALIEPQIYECVHENAAGEKLHRQVAYALDAGGAKELARPKPLRSDMLAHSRGNCR